MKVSYKTAAGKSPRVCLLDEIRGFAIICMVIYHALYSLNYEFGVDIPVFFDGWFGVIRDFFAGTFVFISGIMCRYSHDNIRRGAECFFLGMLITFTVPFFSTNEISFGVLHMLGISMMLYGLFGRLIEKIPPTVGLVLSALLAAFTWNAARGYVGFGALKLTFPETARNVGVLFPLGIIPKNYGSADYFPMMPWFFVFLAGGFCGFWFKNQSVPKAFYKPHCKPLGAVGRVTVWIYMLHMPIIFALFTLIFR